MNMKMFAGRLARILKCKRGLALQRLDSAIKHISSSSSCNNYCHAYNNSPISFLNEDHDSQQLSWKRKLDFYLPVEAAHAHKILSTSGDYSNSLASPLSVKENLHLNKVENLLDKQWIDMSNSEVLENFELLSHYLFQNQEDPNDSKYSRILKLLINYCTNFNDDELHHFLNCLKLWNIRKGELHSMIKTVLSDECLKRMPNWSVDQIFLFNDHLYKLNMTGSEFSISTLQNIRFRKITPQNLVQFAFLMKVTPRVLLPLHIFEDVLKKYANELTIEELAIIAMAFFKYETAIQNKELFKIFMQKLYINIETISDIALSSILKILRYSIDLSTIQYYDILLKKLVSQVSSRSLTTVTHLAHMQARILIYNKEITSKILERYEKEIKTVRLKDIERIALTLFILNYNSNSTSFYSTAVNELLNPSRNEEIKAHPATYVYAVLYMLQANYYSEEIVTRVMDPTFIELFCKGDFNKFSREYLVIDYCLEIEHPDYTGPRVKKHLLNFLLKKFGALRKEDVPNTLNQGNRLMTAVAHTCKLALGAESAIHIDALLPHFAKRNIVVCYNEETNTYLSPAEKLSKIPVGEIKYAPNDNNKWYVLLMGTHNVMTRNTLTPTGILTLEMRHLERIGYTPIVIPYIEWNKQTSWIRKQNYIKSILHV